MIIPQSSMNRKKHLHYSSPLAVEKLAGRLHRLVWRPRKRQGEPIGFGLSVEEALKQIDEEPTPKNHAAVEAALRLLEERGFARFSNNRWWKIGKCPQASGSSFTALHDDADWATVWEQTGTWQCTLTGAEAENRERSETQPNRRKPRAKPGWELKAIKRIEEQPGISDTDLGKLMGVDRRTVARNPLVISARALVAIGERQLEVFKDPRTGRREVRGGNAGQRG